MEIRDNLLTQNCTEIKKNNDTVNFDECLKMSEALDENDENVSPNKIKNENKKKSLLITK
jgi:hypothetical protein